MESADAIRRPPVWAIALLAIPFGTLVEPVSAASVRIERPLYGNNELIYEAGPGEENAVSMATDIGASFTLTDPGVSITPEGEKAVHLCTTAPGTVTCTAPSLSDLIVAINVNTGDGNDTVTGSAAGIGDLNGGPGDDRLVGGYQYGSILNGGPGADDLSGAPGIPTDSLVALYDVESGPVQVSLDDLANDGAPGEGDNVHSEIGTVHATDGGDLLVGSALSNTLFAGAGRDRVRGLGGDDQISGDTGADLLDGGEGADSLDGSTGKDRITGGPGTDALIGKSGADVILAADGEPDHIRCGRGRDRVVADIHDTLSRGCERVTRRRPESRSSPR